jgi:hypothetical protein
MPTYYSNNPLQQNNMEKYFVAGGRYSPTLTFDADKNLLEFSGKSYPEHPDRIYNPALEWITRFLATKGRNITVNLNLSYFNTASSRPLREIFKMLEMYEKEKKGTVLINWYYTKDDDDMMEMGEDYMAQFKLNVKFIETK